MPCAVPPAIEHVARDVFGFSELRPGQREAVESLLAGRDTLAVMSTGYGKSAIYQIAAMLIPGPTVVVSVMPSRNLRDVCFRSVKGARQAPA